MIPLFLYFILTLLVGFVAGFALRHKVQAWAELEKDKILAAAHNANVRFHLSRLGSTAPVLLPVAQPEAPKAEAEIVEFPAGQPVQE